MQVVEQKLTCIVAASEDKKLAKKAQGLFASDSMRINLSTDVKGVEVCGALKNVLAIAAGIVEGKGLGSNALAAVVRALSWLRSCSSNPWHNMKFCRPFHLDTTDTECHERH